jgi:hypothetical protein
MKKFFLNFQSRFFAWGFIIALIGGIMLVVFLWGEISSRLVDSQTSNTSNNSTCEQPVNWVRIQNRAFSIDEESRIIVKVSDNYVERQCADSLSMEISASGFEVQPSIKQTVSIAPNKYNSIEWILVPKETGNLRVTVSGETESYTRGVFVFYFLGMSNFSVQIVGSLFFPIGILLLAVDSHNRKYRKRVEI